MLHSWGPPKLLRQSPGRDVAASIFVLRSSKSLCLSSRFAFVSDISLSQKASAFDDLHTANATKVEADHTLMEFDGRLLVSKSKGNTV